MCVSGLIEIDDMTLIFLALQVNNHAPPQLLISPGDDLTSQEVMRYGRQLILPLVGVEGINFIFCIFSPSIAHPIS